jgi:hypothetical protein
LQVVWKLIGWYRAVQAAKRCHHRKARARCAKALIRIDSARRRVERAAGNKNIT